MSSAANSTGSVALDPGEISFNNPNLGAGATSGSLRASLWTVSGSYAGGAISGAVIARYTITFTDASNQLRNFTSSNLAAQTLPATTPAGGSYCAVVTFEEFSSACAPGGSFCIVDWVQFPGSVQFQ